MYRKDITYTNFNGQETTRPFYFNITKAELALRELESDGTWSESMKAIAASNKGSVVLPEFKKLVKWTYGEKSADGESFEKSDEIWAKFENSEPWSALMMELLTDAKMAADFFNNCMPPDMVRARLEAEATPGFRPGADISRPGNPVVGTGGAQTPAANDQTPAQIPAGNPVGGIVQPQQPAPVEQPYDPNAYQQAPVAAQQPLQPEVYTPSPQDDGVIRQSQPRHSEFEGNQQ